MGRSPLPPPPEKPTGIRRHGKGKKGWSFPALSCLRGSPVADSDVRHSVAPHRKAPWFSWSKKKTVPVDAPATEPMPEKTRPDSDWRKDRGDSGDGEGDRPGLQGQRRQAQTRIPASAATEVPSHHFFRKLQKGNRNSGCTGSPMKHDDWSLHRQEQPPRHPFVYPKYDIRRGQPAPTPPQPVRAVSSCSSSPTAVPNTVIPSSTAPASTRNLAGTRLLGGTRRRNRCEESSSVGRHDQVAGLSVLALVLLLLMLVGRASAVVCTCVWLYFLPRLRDAPRQTTGGGSRCSVEVDFDSEEYKKRVVLEGLLERNGRRLAGFS